MLNSKLIKKDFPIFTKHPDLVYLDSAATTQKPSVVLQAMESYYTEYTSNVSRGLYPMAETATLAVDQSREKIAEYINAESDEVIFVANATDGINLVAHGLRETIKPHQNIVVTASEHHSNFLPWKELTQATGAELRIAPIESNGSLSPEKIAALVDENTLIVAFTALSNVLGILNPAQAITEAIRIKKKDVFILVDACQAVGHMPVSFSEWDVDFLVFSGHKVFGPTGIGILAGKKESLQALGSAKVGGGTILNPLCTPALYKDVPERFEAGTPHIAGIVGLAAALTYVQKLGLDAIRKHEKMLTTYALKRLRETFGDRVQILGNDDPDQRSGIIAFTLQEVHPHDIAHVLGEKNICIRAGEHCAKPLHHSLDVDASARISFSLYNTTEDIDNFVTELQNAYTLLT